MALHRDIYWVGKQWAVTGYGMQACDQKQKGKFDIEASRLWEDGVLESLRAEPWFNPEDFDKALAAARKHYPEPPRKAALAERSAVEEASVRRAGAETSIPMLSRQKPAAAAVCWPANRARIGQIPAGCGAFAFGDNCIELAGFASAAIAG